MLGLATNPRGVHTADADDPVQAEVGVDGGDHANLASLVHRGFGQVAAPVSGPYRTGPGFEQQADPDAGASPVVEPFA
jgi:hypothetical protein